MARAVWKPAPDLATSAEAWITAGGPHHTVLSTALTAEHLWDLSEMVGTELALKYGRDHDVEGVILLSPPLHRATPDEVAAWAGDERRMVVVVPEFDDYLRPDEARERFAAVPDATVIAVEGGKHLWVGESQTRRVLTEIVAAVNPDALPLPTEWDDQAEWDDQE